MHIKITCIHLSDWQNSNNNKTQKQLHHCFCWGSRKEPGLWCMGRGGWLRGTRGEQRGHVDNCSTISKHLSWRHTHSYLETVHVQSYWLEHFFVIAEDWKYKYPLIGNWLNKLPYTHIMEFYVAIKKKKEEEGERKGWKDSIRIVSYIPGCKGLYNVRQKARCRRGQNPFVLKRVTHTHNFCLYVMR